MASGTQAMSQHGSMFTSPSAALISSSTPPHHRVPPPRNLWSVQPAPGEDKEARYSWAETWEVDHVERVLTPLFLTLTALSNLTLLGHEARLVWRTRRLIPPKLLVMALSSADLMATLLGSLSLWVLSVLSRDQHGASSVGITTQQPRLGVMHPSLQPGMSTLPRGGVAAGEMSPLHGSQGAGSLPLERTVGYCLALFLLTAFWTLAQCIVVVMGVERFLALRVPYFYAARCTCSAFLAVVMLLGAASCAVAGFHLAMHLRKVQKRQPLTFAGFTDQPTLAYDAFTLGQGLVWTAVLLLSNWAVTHELQRMERSVTVIRSKDQHEYLKQLSMVHGAGREFARFMMAVNVLFVLSAFPNLVCVVLRLCGSPPRFAIQYFCWRMLHISALLNPFLYGFLRKSLRSRIRCFLYKHVQCLRPHRVDDDDPGPSVRYENHEIRRATPSSAVMPRDPEASIVHISD